MLFFTFLVSFFMSYAVLNGSVMSDSWRPHGLEPTRLLCPRGFSRQEYWSGLSCPPPGDLSSLGIEPRSPAFQADSLPSEPPRKAENTGLCTLSLLQGIFLTQESNRGLLHCRWILYQLRYQGRPSFFIFNAFHEQQFKTAWTPRRKAKFKLSMVSLTWDSETFFL